MTGWLIALGGAASGVAQAGLLARAALGRPNPFSLVARLVLVTAVLLLAARMDRLVSGAAGWIVGFVAADVLVQWRLR